MTFTIPVLRVELSDVNDQSPVIHLPSACVTVTEFHDPRDVITLVTADDADDVTTPNGRVRFSIAAGNQDGECDERERRGGQPGRCVTEDRGGKSRSCPDLNSDV